MEAHETRNLSHEHVLRAPEKVLSGSDDSGDMESTVIAIPLRRGYRFRCSNLHHHSNGVQSIAIGDDVIKPMKLSSLREMVVFTSTSFIKRASWLSLCLTGLATGSVTVETSSWSCTLYSCAQISRAP